MDPLGRIGPPLLGPNQGRPYGLPTLLLLVLLLLLPLLLVLLVLPLLLLLPLLLPDTIKKQYNTGHRSASQCAKLQGAKEKKALELSKQAKVPNTEVVSDFQMRLPRSPPVHRASCARRPRRRVSAWRSSS